MRQEDRKANDLLALRIYDELMGDFNYARITGMVVEEFIKHCREELQLTEEAALEDLGIILTEKRPFNIAGAELDVEPYRNGNGIMFRGHLVIEGCFDTFEIDGCTNLLKVHHEACKIVTQDCADCNKIEKMALPVVDISKQCQKCIYGKTL